MRYAGERRAGPLHKGRMLALLLAALLCVGGCAPKDIVPEAGQIQLEAPQQEALPEETQTPPLETVPPISPNAGGSVAEQREVSLYYRMQGEDMLAVETRRLYIPLDKRPEQQLIEALIAGPSPDHLELVSLFSTGTQVEVWSSGTVLTVQLSREFLMKPTDAPVLWEEDPQWRSEVLLRRELALASIVNAVTEATSYTAVQFYVLDRSYSASGRRLLQSEIYAGGDLELLGAQGHSEHYLLTHYNTASIILQCWQEQSYDRLYRFVAQDVQARPTDAAFLKDVEDRDRSLISYRISAGAISEDGKRAVLEATYQYIMNGQAVQVESFPLTLVRENGIWKITYAELIRMMEAL